MSGTVWDLAAATIVFVLTHVGLSTPAVRSRLAGGLGETGFAALYSIVALAALAWVVIAYRAAPAWVVWQAGIGIRSVAAAVVLVACVLVFAGYSVRNPTMVMAERLFGTDHPLPGITRVTRHPVMWGVGLWALAHLAATGDIASLILFGALALLALGGTVLIDRKMAVTDAELWRRLAAETSNLPFAALAAGRSRVTPADIGWWRLAGGVVLFLVLLALHKPVVGVWPL